jgi:RNA polymerase sigma-70 factor (ECF subfamily)
LLDARRDALQRCLGKLSAADRQLVSARYQPEGSTRGVAESLGRSVQGTRKALHRIRMALMACIQRNTAREEPA